MPKFLCKVSYTPEGAKGLLKEGGTARRAAVEKLFQSAGGKVESFYFAMGQDDAYLICEMPDDVSGLALSMTVAAAGGARLSTLPLLTCEQADQASKKSISYRPPGK